MGLFSKIFNTALIVSDVISSADDKIIDIKEEYRQKSDGYLLDRLNNDTDLFSFTRFTALKYLLIQKILITLIIFKKIKIKQFYY